MATPDEEARTERIEKSIGRFVGTPFALRCRSANLCWNEQLLHDELMGVVDPGEEPMTMNYWPETLQDLANARVQRLGVCGDVVATAVADWIRGVREGGDVKLAEAERRGEARVLKGALGDVVAERRRQDEKWGEQNHDPFTYLTVLMEEVGELSQAALHARFGGHAAEKLRIEAVQTAAVALAIVECLDRAKWSWRTDTDNNGNPVRAQQAAKEPQP